MVTTQLFRLQNIVKICAALNCVFFRLLQIKWFLIRPLTQICIFEGTGTVGQSRTSTWRLKCVLEINQLVRCFLQSILFVLRPNILYPRMF